MVRAETRGRGRAVPAGPVYYLALASFLLGNAAVVYINVLTIRVISGHPGLLVAALLVPAYWVMMSIAAAKAAYQLALKPSYWEKTSHGLSGNAPAAGSTAAAHPTAARSSAA